MTAPNILLFLTDDHAQWALGCYGNAEIRTPTLDNLAKSGCRFVNAFTPTPVCSPARACLHTGRLASQHGIHDYLASADPDINGRKWLENEKTLAEILHKQGYKTAQIGKWHLGQDEFPQPGYDEWFTLGRGYPILHEGPHKYGFEGRQKEIPGRITAVITERAKRFLNSMEAATPFFLTVGYYATHSPWEGQSESLVERYRQSKFKDIPLAHTPSEERYPFGIQTLESTNETRHNPREALSQYYAAVTEIDTAVGHIIETLKSNEQLENTLIIYTSDHGLNCGHHGIWGKGNGTLPLNMVEESIRIPLILSQPSICVPGIECEAFVDHLDTFQTILACANSSHSNNNYAGRSYRPFLQNQMGVNWRQHQFAEYGPVRMVRDARYKLVQRAEPEKSEFFDLENDPREMINMIDAPIHQERILALAQKVDNYFTTYSTPEFNGRLGKALPQTNFSEAWR